MVLIHIYQRDLIIIILIIQSLYFTGGNFRQFIFGRGHAVPAPFIGASGGAVRIFFKDKNPIRFQYAPYLSKQSLNPPVYILLAHAFFNHVIHCRFPENKQVPILIVIHEPAEIYQNLKMRCHAVIGNQKSLRQHVTPQIPAVNQVGMHMMEAQQMVGALITPVRLASHEFIA